MTKNESANIRRCIESLNGLVERIVVVDSFSTDDTVSIAQSLGADVYTRSFVHYADQFNWALDYTNIQTPWVYRIDADEQVTPELKAEILASCSAHLDDDVHGFLMKHKLFFLGKYLKHGGVYPFIKMTVFKPKYARFENRAMGEHVVLQCGRSIELKHDCIHHDCKSLTAFIDKHNAYATREVQDYYAKNQVQQASLYDKAERTKHLRDDLYYKLPKFLRARLYFWYRYYFQLGFLDGYPGKIYAFIQAYAYRMMVDAKIYEAEVHHRGH